MVGAFVYGRQHQIQIFRKTVSIMCFGSTFRKILLRSHAYWPGEFKFHLEIEDGEVFCNRFSILWAMAMDLSLDTDTYIAIQSTPKYGYT